MKNDTIQIAGDTLQIDDCVSVILIPEIALTEPGYIKTMTVSADAHSKHEYFAMAQMAYYQYQDGELDIVPVTGPLQVKLAEVVEEVISGMIIYRDATGEFHVLMHRSLNGKKMLETANRYCTRWVRLDI
jgi:predicted membrane protein